MALLLLFLFVPQTESEFVVITSRQTALDQISIGQLRRLYLMRIDRVSGARLVPLCLRRPSDLQERFDDWLFGAGFDLENHWLEERLRGGADPPLEVPNTAHLMVYIERNPGFIGFLPADRLGALEGMAIKVLDLR